MYFYKILQCSNIYIYPEFIIYLNKNETFPGLTNDLIVSVCYVYRKKDTYGKYLLHIVAVKVEISVPVIHENVNTLSEETSDLDIETLLNSSAECIIVSELTAFKSCLH